ncbi:hypothetical protein F2P79_020824%2C partial [Xyrichtys novacula]|uniref:Reverse transcriptase n=1 Tax=Xyrichtys novacula TaxID=13765 RepID=A0AAV1FZZ0_XYRNO|nr:hypothetical protein F2P79_020824%2C partial [Xyrichtys novacula]
MSPASSRQQHAHQDKWFGSEGCCSLCNTPNATLQHILSGCEIALSQGCYRWRHNRVLRKLAEVLEGCRQRSKESPPAENHNHINFVTESWGKDVRPGKIPKPFSPDQEWDMRVDLDRQLHVPVEITTTSFRPDIVVGLTKAKSVLLIELKIPAEEGIEAAYERKKAKYSELAAECQEAGWKATIYPVEVGCRGYEGLSTTRLLRDVGVTGGNLKKATKELAEEA